jgi:pimeloyl-ACP methyl ester carboxylesterase
MAIRKMIGSLVPSGPAVLGGLARTLGRPAPLVGATPHDVVFRENKWSLLRYRPHAPGSGGADVVTHRHPILLVPSLINRHYVLDLMPGKSFAEYLARQGYDVFCIDWGTPEDEDRYLTFDDFVDRYIGRALRVTCRTAGSGKAHLLGYCLGGTMAIIHAALHEERIASLALVAAPVRFDDESLLALWTQSPTFDVDALVRPSTSRRRSRSSRSLRSSRSGPRETTRSGRRRRAGKRAWTASSRSRRGARTTSRFRARPTSSTSARSTATTRSCGASCRSPGGACGSRTSRCLCSQ